MPRFLQLTVKRCSPFAVVGELGEEMRPALAGALARTFELALRHPLRLPGRRQIGLLACLLMIAILSFGAVGVTTELIRKPQSRHAAQSVVAGWGRDVILGMAPAERAVWSRLVAEDPTLVLSVCSVELPATRE